MHLMCAGVPGKQDVYIVTCIFMCMFIVFLQAGLVCIFSLLQRPLGARRKPFEMRCAGGPGSRIYALLHVPARLGSSIRALVRVPAFLQSRM